MALNPVLVSTLIQKGLYERSSLFSRVNRAYDSLVAGRWAKSVDVPKNPQLVVRGTPAAKNSGDRKKTKADMGTVNVPFQTRFVHMIEEYESRAETNGDALDSFVEDVVKAFEEDFDTLVMNEALASAVTAGGANLKEWAGEELTKRDLDAITSFMIQKKVPDIGQIVVIPSIAAESFKNIDIVVQAMAHNKDLLEKGVAIIDKVTYIISANLNLVDGKPALVGFYDKGIAFVMKRYLDRKEAWDTEEAIDYIDWMAFVAVKCTKSEFSCASVQP